MAHGAYYVYYAYLTDLSYHLTHIISSMYGIMNKVFLRVIHPLLPQLLYSSSHCPAVAVLVLVLFTC
jgi:hypothetical protein